MKNGKIRACCLFLAAALPLMPALRAQSQYSREGSGWAFQGLVPGKHRGAITALVHLGDTVLSAGTDGFLEIWDARAGRAAERLQLTRQAVISMAARPGKSEICVIESDGLGLCRLSAWDYKKRRRLFSLSFAEPIEYINYSAGGNFIIAAGTGAGLLLIDSQSGETRNFSRLPEGTALFAATGRSDRSMLAYFSSGIISYWDLENGEETSRFEAEGGLSSLVSFANSRYLAGLTPGGLVVLDAVSGSVLARNSSIGQGSLLCAEGDELFCLSGSGAGAELRRLYIDSSGRLLTRERLFLRLTINSISSASANKTIALGTVDGSPMLVERNGQIRNMTARDPIRITETAVSGPAIAFLSENSALGFLPLDYSRITDRETLGMEKNDAYTRISPYTGAGGDAARFIFWQPENTRILPMIRSPYIHSPPLVLNEMVLRSPLRAVSAADEKLLFLDSVGNISVLSPFDRGKNQLFSFFSIGSIDAAFVNRDTIILGRSAISRNTPFLAININTGETVPLPYPSQAGVMVYTGDSGSVYAAAVDQDQDGIKTAILRLNTANPVRSVRLAEWKGEDNRDSFAEAEGYFAAIIGGEGAALYSTEDFTARQFERTPGLPERLASGGRFFISLDEEGIISWHENRTGKLLAVFRLYRGEWVLQTEKGTISGPTP